ncbi:unnamed protein product [Ectocarpus sp. 12 AP-2014]
MPGSGTGGSDEGEEAGAGASHRRGSDFGSSSGRSVHDIVPDVPSVGERRGSGDHGRVGADLGWGEGANQTGPGSVKERLGAFSSGGGKKAGDDGTADAADGSGGRREGDGSRAAAYLRPLRGSGSQASATTSDEGSEEARDGIFPTSGRGPHRRRGSGGSIEGRVNALYGSKTTAEEGSTAAAGGGGGRQRRGDVHGAVGELAEATGAGAERRVGRVGSGSVGWGEGKDQGAPGTVKDRVGAIGSGGGGGGAPAGGRPPPHQTGAVRAAAAAHGGLSSSSLASGEARSPPPSSTTRKAIGSRAVSRSDSGGGTGSTPSPPKRKSSMTRDEAVAALAEAEAEADREEEEWALKVKELEKERRKARDERRKLAVETAEAAGLPPPPRPSSGKWKSAKGALGDAARDAAAAADQDGDTEAGSPASRPGGLVGVRARALRLEEDAKKRAADAKKAVPSAVRPLSRSASGGVSGSASAVPPLSRSASGGVSGAGGGTGRKPRKRSMRKSGFPLGSLDSAGSATSKDEDDGGDGEDTTSSTWPKPGLAFVAAYEDADGGMEAKKPIEGWDPAEGMVPWRSPERAPEYGGTEDDSDPKKPDTYIRSASFGGNPMEARNSPWGSRDEKPSMYRNYSLNETGAQEEADVSWSAVAKDGEDDAVNHPKKGKGDVILESMLFKDDAKEIGIVELKVMNLNTSEDKREKPTRRAPTWNQYYFRLREETLTKSLPRRSSFPGNANQQAEDMKLTSATITSYTNTKNCFCVRTDEVSWFLLARSLDDMKRWMSAINLRARHIFQREHGVHDDYMGQGRRGRFFYRMVEGSVPQWILTHPMTKAPRTGDGLFPGEVVEVTQVLSSEGVTFLRLANDRGWTFARSPADGSVLFEDLAGGVAEDTDEYTFPPGASGMVPILHGPGLKTQATGVMVRPGERVRASERFTPLDNSKVVFVKLQDGRGWMPLKSEYGGPSTILQGW